MISGLKDEYIHGCYSKHVGRIKRPPHPDFKCAALYTMI